LELVNGSREHDVRLRELKAAANPADFPLALAALPTILSTSADERLGVGMQLMLGSTKSVEEEENT
jgi:hypothetical protein